MVGGSRCETHTKQLHTDARTTMRFNRARELRFGNRFASRRSPLADVGTITGMGIGISVLLLAVGGLLTFAVTAEVTGVNLDAVGWVLMVVGAIGLVWSLLAAASIRPFARREERVVERP